MYQYAITFVKHNMRAEFKVRIDYVTVIVNAKHLKFRNLNRRTK